MNNNEFAEKVMGWTWYPPEPQSPHAFNGNWWFDGDKKTEFGSHSMHGYRGFYPRDRIDHALMLLDKLQEYPAIEWSLDCTRRIDDLFFSCTISKYWERDGVYEGYGTTPQEAVCNAVEKVVETL